MNDHDQDSVEIRSCRGRRSLRFHGRKGDDFIVSIEGDGPTGTRKVWGYSDAELLKDLFDSMATDWRGWSGERAWASIEQDLRITATSKVTGGVTLRVEIRHFDGEDNWNLVVPIFVEPGQLDAIARDVARFFR